MKANQIKKEPLFLRNININNKYETRKSHDESWLQA